MAKKSVIERNNKRIKMEKKFFKKRKSLKKIIKDPKISKENRWNAIIKLQKLPRDSSIIRQRNRCKQTGRSRSFIRRFGLSRIKTREFAMRGDIPGLTKSSW
ncbi:30S ribosomal protein S14 [Candidatus Annandia adelgestsuga]|uniref:Small ribosomal subunit protein uS14 n=1 Tax=Candidatus Annandia adelgestsuga TaxID=1302411 RepID=A0A3Q9CP29_9ENTR|nr:30S ribosomal protein S14 [Candidatus Annandia adelgestsuga]AZP36209.1 30S ribosomal protein S14 [Candidatus Annandia adelgestsuga]